MDPRLSALRLPALTLPLLLSAACPAPPQHLGDFTTDSDADDSSATSAATDDSSADPSADPSAGEQPGALDGVEVSFVQIDARYPGAPTIELTPALIGQPLELSGSLTDAGDFILFVVHAYDDYRVQFGPVTHVVEPLAEAPTESALAWVHATLISVDEDGEQPPVLEVDAFQLAPPEPIAAALAASCDWLDARIDQIDANLIKPSARWDELLAAHQNLDADADLNAPAYTPSRYALYWDEGAARVQLHCGSRPIAADPLLQSTTEYAVVYDLDADAIERVLVDELTLAL